MNPESRTVLIVVHDYPPIYSAGTERVLKFSQHLPDFGYRPIILTTARYGGLSDDAEQKVFRAGDLVHTLFSPLRRRKVAGAAASDQVRIARDAPRPATRRRASAADHLQQLAARNRAPHRRQPCSRDRGALGRRPARWLAVRAARAGPSRKQRAPRAGRPHGARHGERYAGIIGRTATISNGYDAAGFAGLERQRPADGAFRLTYTGAFSGSSQGRSADSLFAAIAQVAAADRLAERHGIAELVSFLPPVPRREAYQRQMDADALLLVTAPGVRSVATSKLYDYIGAGRPILALAEGNAAAETVRRFGLGVTVAPDNLAAIADGLRELMRRHAAGEGWPGFAEARRHFERRQLTESLARLFDEVLDERR